MKRTLAVATLLVMPGMLSSQASARDATLKNALRNLVVVEEGYFAKHGTYTTDVSALGLFAPGAPRDSVWVQVVNAGGRSWNGRAIHMGARAKSCVIWVGYKTDLPSAPVTDSDSLAATREGEPVCDRM